VEFTYYNDKLPPDKITKKETKYVLLIDYIKNKCWQVAPLIVIIAKARGAIYQTTKMQLH
jgi:hypothetical protein